MENLTSALNESCNRLIVGIIKEGKIEDNLKGFSYHQIVHCDIRISQRTKTCTFIENKSSN